MSLGTLQPPVVAALFVAICLVLGVALLVATARGWQGPRWSDGWDALGIQRLMYRIAGGPAAYYRGLGWMFLTIGGLTVMWWLVAS